MVTPKVRTVDNIKKWDIHNRVGDRLTPSRPLSHSGINIYTRIKLAWSVFIGKYDALDWEDV